MAHERWGTFSVIDHRDAAALAAEVLLYDRLVLPVPPTLEERQRWEERGWQPELLDERLEVLGALAIKASWGSVDRQSAYHAWAAQYVAAKLDTEQLVKEAKERLGYQMTRMVLAQMTPPLPRGVSGITLVPAYQSKQDLSTDFSVRHVRDERAQLALDLRVKIAMPIVRANPERGLVRAVELVRDADFKRKRRRLYDLQERILAAGTATASQVQKMEQLAADLIQYVGFLATNVRIEFLHTLAGLKPGTAVGLQHLPIKSDLMTMSPIGLEIRNPALAEAITPGSPMASYH